MTEMREGQVIVEGDAQGFAQGVLAGRHELNADEPQDAGGTDTGPSPYQLLLAALGSCTSMTVALYARRKQWPLNRVRVTLSHARQHAADCAACEAQDAHLERIERAIELEGTLTAEQRQRLLAIAEKCPVHRTLQSTITIVSRLV
jgi:uncharacterized OsmC-like protein